MCMKRFLLAVSILISAVAVYPCSGRNSQKARLSSVIAECRSYEGVEGVRGLAVFDYEDCSLVCIFGSVSLEDFEKLMSDD